MNQPLISVILPCFGMGRYVGEALASIETQSHSNWEIVAVDDAGPEDGTREAFAAFAARHPGRRVELLRHATNRGVSAARNTALAAARGELVAFLDPDDSWLPGHLALHARAFAQDASLGVSASPARVLSRSPRAVPGEVEFFSTWDQDLFPQSLGLRNGVVMSASVVRPAILGAHLHFDETPELQHAEDWDLWLRLAGAGIKFALLDEVSAVYRRHEGAATHRQDMIRQRMQALARKHASLLFEYQWVTSVHLANLVRWHEEKLQLGWFRRAVRAVGRRIRRWRQSGS